MRKKKEPEQLVLFGGGGHGKVLEEVHEKAGEAPAERPLDSIADFCYEHMRPERGVAAFEYRTEDGSLYSTSLCLGAVDQLRAEGFVVRRTR